MGDSQNDKIRQERESGKLKGEMKGKAERTKHRG